MFFITFMLIIIEYINPFASSEKLRYVFCHCKMRCWRCVRTLAALCSPSCHGHQYTAPQANNGPCGQKRRYSKTLSTVVRGNLCWCPGLFCLVSKRQIKCWGLLQFTNKICFFLSLLCFKTHCTKQVCSLQAALYSLKSKCQRARVKLKGMQGNGTTFIIQVCLFFVLFSVCS